MWSRRPWLRRCCDGVRGVPPSCEITGVGVFGVLKTSSKFSPSSDDSDAGPGTNVDAPGVVGDARGLEGVCLGPKRIAALDREAGVKSNMTRRTPG